MVFTTILCQCYQTLFTIYVLHLSVFHSNQLISLTSIHADDVVLFAERQEHLPLALQSMADSPKFGLHISCAEMKVQKLGVGPDAKNQVVKGQTVDEVSELCCGVCPTHRPGLTMS